jgi:hypothetical protein
MKVIRFLLEDLMDDRKIDTIIDQRTNSVGKEIRFHFVEGSQKIIWIQKWKRVDDILEWKNTPTEFTQEISKVDRMRGVKVEGGDVVISLKIVRGRGMNNKIVTVKGKRGEMVW